MVIGTMLAMTIQGITGVEHGHLSAYDKTPTDATIAYRQELGQIPTELSGYDTLVAVLDCGRVGQEVHIVTSHGKLNGLVFDCAGQADGGYDWMVENSIVAEVDWYTWEKHPELIGQEAIVYFLE